MDCFKEINLPTPLSAAGLQTLTEMKMNGINTSSPDSNFTSTVEDVDQYLNPDLHKVFNELNLHPNSLRLIGHVNDFLPAWRTFVHVDQYFNFNLKKFVTVPFSINWELTEAKPVLYWWDVGNAQRHYPGANHRVANLSAIHDRSIQFGHWERKKETLHYKLLDQYNVKKDQAILLNTSVPHSSYYEVNTDSRITVSIRFPIEEIATWDEAVKIFADYLL